MSSTATYNLKPIKSTNTKAPPLPKPPQKQLPKQPSKQPNKPLIEKTQVTTQKTEEKKQVVTRTSLPPPKSIPPPPPTTPRQSTTPITKSPSPATTTKVPPKRQPPVKPIQMDRVQENTDIQPKSFRTPREASAGRSDEETHSGSSTGRRSSILSKMSKSSDFLHSNKEKKEEKKKEKEEKKKEKEERKKEKEERKRKEEEEKKRKEEERKKEEEERKRKEEEEKKRKEEEEKAKKEIVITYTEFLSRYKSDILDDDPESRIKFIPKNREGKKVNGSELLMHTAELMYTEFMFCCKLHIFQTFFQNIIRDRINLLDYQDYLLFDPLDKLVTSITSMCEELEPIYYDLLDHANCKDEEIQDLVMNTVLKYYSFVNGIKTDNINLTKVFTPFVSHYTSLSNTINDFISNNKQLNKLIQNLLDMCIDKNIKQFDDMYFAPTQRICRYELLLQSIAKELKEDSKVKKYLNETIVSYKEMNINVNEMIFKSKYFYLKKYDYLDQIFKTNKPLMTVNLVKEHFNDVENFVSFHEGHKVELCIFVDGLLKEDIKSVSFDFYPIETLFTEEPNEEESISEKEKYVSFYDYQKKKYVSYKMNSKDIKESFDYSLHITYHQYRQSK